MNIIIAYQFKGSANIYAHDLPDYSSTIGCSIHWWSAVHMMSNIVAKWIIKLKQNAN